MIKISQYLLSLIKCNLKSFMKTCTFFVHFTYKIEYFVYETIIFVNDDGHFRNMALIHQQQFWRPLLYHLTNPLNKIIAKYKAIKIMPHNNKKVK